MEEMMKFPRTQADTPRDEQSPGIWRATRGVAAGAAGRGTAWRQREHTAALGGLGKGDLAALLLPPARARAGAEAAVAQLEQDRKLALLFEATRAVTSSLVLEDVLELVTRTTAEVMGTFAADTFD